MSSLGVVVLSVPGMKHLSACLESVRWAEAVFLFHLGDEGPSIRLESYPYLVLRRAVSMQEVGQSCRDLGTDWILHLWGEEAVEPDLRDELRDVCRRELSQTPSAYRIAIRSQILGRWVEGSLLGPSPAPRLSRRVEEIPCGWWDTREIALAEYPTLPRGWIGDSTASELENGVDRLQDISKLWAERIQRTGSKLSLAACVLFPLKVFIRTLLRNGVFTKGFAGLTLSILAAYAVLLTTAKVWEQRNVRGNGKGAGPGAVG